MADPGDEWEFYPGLSLWALLSFVYTLLSDRAETQEAQQELDAYLGLGGRPDDKATIRAALAEFGEVTVERSE